MDRLSNYIIFVVFTSILSLVDSYTYSVKISTDSHVNVVDSRFLSFTVDPKYLFSNSEKHNSKESVCMAAALTPAYIRIAGPSTAHMTFHNSTITFTDLTDLELESDEEETPKKKESARKISVFDSDEEDDHILPKKSKETFGFRKRLSLPSLDSDSEEHYTKKTLGFKNKRQSIKGYLKKGKDIHEGKKKKETKELAVTHSQWQQFVHWTKRTGFDLVFALNNEEKTPNGLWDPNPALNILTLADQANISDVFWQLGYECTNQSVDDYLNDLDTLRAIVETFSSAEGWRSVGGDVSKCLQADSKSDFRDYVTLTDDMMDAVVLNGNSSARELQRMSEEDRIHLLRLLSTSSTPLWLTDSPQTTPHSELHRAADWMTSLGYSARNGFAVYFRELIEEELYEPTLSFYTALLFKNLVGERVLDVSMDVSQAVVFAHCTSLRHKPIPGAVTLYGANMDDETARFAVKLSRREDGGDIMQFILGHDLHGNIIINGRPMFEGDIRPVVKRVRPYKTLLLNLPPRSFGFWVIANTRIDACHENDDDDITKKEFVEATPVDDDEFASSSSVKTKRSMINDDGTVHNVSKETLVKEGLRDRVEALKININNVNKFFEEKSEDETVLSRRRRHIDVEDDLENAKRKVKKFFRNKLKSSDEPKPRLDFIRKFIGMNPRSEVTRTVRHNKVRKTIRNSKSKGTKRSPKFSRPDTIEKNSIDDIITSATNSKLSRKRRNVINDERKDTSHKTEDVTTENEIFDAESSKEMKLWRILHKIHKQIKDLSIEEEDENREKNENSENAESKDEEQFIVRTKMAEDGATINFKEKTKHGLLKSTVNNVVSVLSDLNKNLNRFWNALTLLE